MFTVSASAQSYLYVRAGATGLNNGIDWTNAYTELPPSLTRGYTYYIADGNYPGYTFDDPVYGSLFITIKKATITDHGTDDGWVNYYGDGQAVFSSSGQSVIGIATSYLEFDGQQEYGIKIYRSDPGSEAYGVNFYSGQSHITYHYVEFVGPGGSSPYNYPYPIRGLRIAPKGSTSSDITVSHCSIHGFSVILLVINVRSFVLEYSDIYDSLSSGSSHPDVLYISGQSDYGTIRYNKIHNFAPIGIYWSGPSEQDVTNWEIYGNVIYNDLSSVPKDWYARAIAVDLHKYSYGSVSNLKIYNNDFVNLWMTLRISNETDIGIGGEFRNNLRYNADGVMTNPNLIISHDTIASSNPFVNLGTFDLHLSSATNEGFPLGFQYNVDMEGNIRGADGVWDRGAYEYKSGVVSPTLIPRPVVLYPTTEKIIDMLSSWLKSIFPFLSW